MGHFWGSVFHSRFPVHNHAHLHQHPLYPPQTPCICSLSVLSVCVLQCGWVGVGLGGFRALLFWAVLGLFLVGPVLGVLVYTGMVVLPDCHSCVHHIRGAQRSLFSSMPRLQGSPPVGGTPLRASPDPWQPGPCVRQRVSSEGNAAVCACLCRTLFFSLFFPFSLFLRTELA